MILKLSKHIRKISNDCPPKHAKMIKNDPDMIPNIFPNDPKYIPKSRLIPKSFQSESNMTPISSPNLGWERPTKEDNLRHLVPHFKIFSELGVAF